MLKRIVEPYQIEKSDYSGELIIRGEFYYEDDEDGYKIKSDEYHQLKMQKKREEFDYSALEKAQNAVEYEQAIKLAEKEFLAAGVLERDIFINGRIQTSSIEKE